MRSKLADFFSGAGRNFFGAAARHVANGVAFCILLELVFKLSRAVYVIVLLYK